MIQNKTFRNDINIEIDPVIINTQIEEIKELNEDFYKEYSEIYNEYTGLIIKLDESSNDLTDFINNQILQNLEKSLDICELSIKILQHKSQDTYISVANIIKNYNLKIPGNENETLCETIANFISFKNDLNYYNNQLIIWNDTLNNPTSKEENSEVKKLRKKVNYHFTNQILFNKEYLSNILLFFDEILSMSEKNNKLLNSAIDCKSLKSYLKYTNIQITNKQKNLFSGFDDLSDYINNMENESNPEDALDYIVDIIKNNIDWPFIFQFMISKINSTINKHGFDYLNENFNNFSNNQIAYLNQILNRFIIPHQDEISRILKSLTKNSQANQKHKSEIISLIDIYNDRLDNIVFDIKRFIMKYQ
ncbi:hypothetical protein ACA135_03180 [Methanobrevibacter acididurans]|uniref:hypothetical protein n=1 Tax=Methanobrevibacter acididurans TaxID=120963 RepID=UPI0038FD2F03